MPINEATGEFERIFHFTDDRDVGEAILRSDLDAALDDLASGLNSVASKVEESTRADRYSVISFPSIPAITSDTTLTYATGVAGTVLADDVICAALEQIAYKVMPATSPGYDVLTAGGVRLRAIRSSIESYVSKSFRTKSDLLADPLMSYTGSTIGKVSPGDVFTIPRTLSRFVVAEHDATDHDAVTSSGVKLYEYSLFEAMSSAAELISGAFPSYQAAADANKDGASRVSAIVGGVLATWFRKTGGPCLGGGWAPDGEVMPEHFGAVGDGVTDDTTAMQAAFDYGAPIRAAASKTYRVGQLSAQCGADFDGNDCTLLVTSASGLIISGGARNAVSRVKDVRVQPTLAPAAGSVGIGFYASSYADRQKIVLENVTFPRLDPVLFNTAGFEKYVKIENAASPELKNVSVSGTYNALSTGGGPSGKFVEYGVFFSGQVIAAKIEHCTITAIHTAVYGVDVLQEGYQIYSTECVGVRDGYVFRTPGPSAAGPGVWFSNCHVNATRVGFDLGFRIDVSLAGCTAYRSSVLYDEPFIGIDLEGAVNVRMSTACVNNSIVAGVNDCIGVRLLNTQMLTSTALTLLNPKRGIVHQGGCNHLVWAGTVFGGTTGYSDTAFETASSDAYVYLGPHELRSTWSAPYVIATRKDSIILDLGRLRYTRTAGVTVSAAGTLTLTAGASQQLQIIGAAAGAAAYDYIIELSAAGAQMGDFFDFYFNLPSALDRRLIVKNGVAGPTIATLATASSARYGARFVFDGANWVPAWINQSVFM